MRKRRPELTKEQAAANRAEYHELANQATKIARQYLAEHPESDVGVIYGACVGAACKYYGNAKFRVQRFEVICLWWIRHRLLIHKSKQEDNDNMIPKIGDKEIADMRADRANGMSTSQISKKYNRAYSAVSKYTHDVKPTGFVDAGEIPTEQREELTAELTALTDKPETVHIEPSGEMLAAIESAAKDDSAEFDIVNELEYMLTNLREMLNTRRGFGNYRIVAASAENNSAVIKYRTDDGLIEMSIRRCSA